MSKIVKNGYRTKWHNWGLFKWQMYLTHNMSSKYCLGKGYCYWCGGAADFQLKSVNFYFWLQNSAFVQLLGWECCLEMCTWYTGNRTSFSLSKSKTASHSQSSSFGYGTKFKGKDGSKLSAPTKICCSSLLYWDMINT